MRGDGRVWRPPGTRFYHAKGYVDGVVVVSGSTGKTTEEEAKRVLRKKLDAIRKGDEAPREGKLTLADLKAGLVADYQRKRNRSLDTMLTTFKHVERFFGLHTRAVKITAEKIAAYVAHRRAEAASGPRRGSESSLRSELSHLSRAFTIAVREKKISARSRPYIELPPEDPNAVRKGFFRRAAMEKLAAQLPPHIGAVVRFLFFCPWRVGAARQLEWRDYSPEDGTLTLRAELNKTKHPLPIPVDQEHTPELMAVIEGQDAVRRTDCPFIFHGEDCTPRFDEQGRRKPCLGDFQKRWDTACITLGYCKGVDDPERPGETMIVSTRIPHDLRRSGVKHYKSAGVDTHVVMAWSGHRTNSMLQRYNILDLDDLRRAGKKASDYHGEKDNLIKRSFGGRRTATAEKRESLGIVEAISGQDAPKSHASADRG
jgi:integrase